MESPARNAAGVPLTLVGTPSATGGEVTIDWSGVPDGIDGKAYTSDDVSAMDAAARQALLVQLIAKYNGVSIDEGNGTRVFNTEMDMTPADDALYQELVHLGAVVPDAAPAAAAPSTDTHAGAADTSDDANTSDEANKSAAPDEPRTLVLEEGDESPIGKTGTVQHPDGTTTAVIVAPHGPIARLLELGGEIKHEAAVTAHRVLVEIDQLVEELKKHL